MSDSTIHRYFAFEHLPQSLREISEPICVAALSDEHPRIILELVFDQLQDLAADGRVIDERQLEFGIAKIHEAEKLLDRHHRATDAFWLLVLEMKDCAVRACRPPAHRTSIRRDDLDVMVQHLADAHRAFADIYRVTESLEVRRICRQALKDLAGWRDTHDGR